MKQKNLISGILLMVLFFLTGCNSNDRNADFPMDKKYWTAEDYHNVNGILFSLNYNKSELPNLDNPKFAPVFNKLVDTMNVSVIANDPQLGITHRNEFLENMFQEYKDLSTKYTALDKKDKYQYPIEFVRILKFGLYLQVPYIQIANEKILKESTNPDDQQTKSVISSNQQILVKNYNIYLDHINFEDRFDDKAIVEYTQGIDEYFPRLITQVIPSADFSDMLELVQNMLKKAKNATLVQTLQTIKSLLENKMKNKTAA